jgi:hypothetical protein
VSPRSILQIARGNGIRYGVFNVSRALEKSGTVVEAFRKCVDAGVVAVGAAGNLYDMYECFSRGKSPVSGVEDL